MLQRASLLVPQVSGLYRVTSFIRKRVLINMPNFCKSIANPLR